MEVRQADMEIFGGKILPGTHKARRLYYAGIIVTVLISILCSCTAVGAIKNSVAPDRGENFSNSSDDSFDQELRASLESNYYLIAIHHTKAYSSSKKEFIM